VRDADGVSGRTSLGASGNTIGRGDILKSGRYTVSPALILDRSKIISGHFGNSIIGGLGIIAETSLKINDCRSCRSFLHS